MSQNSSNVVDLNRAQTNSEVDTFTVERYQQFARHLPAKTKSVMDVGCGLGRGGKALKSCNSSLEITGLDCVPERIEKLDKSIYFHGICAFTDDIAAPDKSFDAIVAGEFLEHLPPSQVDLTLAEFFRVLRLNGRLLMTTPNPHFLLHKFKGGSPLLDEAHLTQHYPDCLAFRMRMVGFSRIKIYGSGKATRRFGPHFPILSVYGSYLVQGDKW
jgi:ubiquinone/menaquinone biosynthesis C-methylase UbiE